MSEGVSIDQLSPEAKKVLRTRQIELPLPDEALGEFRRSDQDAVDRLAMKLVGVLADAAHNGVRRRALEKARRMLGTR